MKQSVFNEYVDVPVELSWPEWCWLACQAVMRMTTIDELVSAAIRERIGYA